MTVIDTNINPSRLYADLERAHREDFTYCGAQALMEYLEDQDEPHEYDPIQFCCDWSEYEDLKELAEAYSCSLPVREDYDNDEEHLAACLEGLEAKTDVIAFTGYDADNLCDKREPSYVVRNF